MRSLRFLHDESSGEMVKYIDLCFRRNRNPFATHCILSTAVESSSQMNLMTNKQIMSVKGIVPINIEPAMTAIKAVSTMATNKLRPSMRGTPPTNGFLANMLYEKNCSFSFSIKKRANFLALYHLN